MLIVLLSKLRLIENMTEDCHQELRLVSVLCLTRTSEVNYSICRKVEILAETKGTRQFLNLSKDKR